MKNYSKTKKFLISITLILVVYIGTFFLFGKDRIVFEIIKNSKIEKIQDSINIEFLKLEEYKKKQNKIVELFKEKGYKEVKIFFDQENQNENDLNYWINIEKLTPFLLACYDGYFKKNKVGMEYESIYVWCFIKWVRIYKSGNRAMY